MYYECSICHAHVDAGELVGGKCDECREAEQEQRIKREKSHSMAGRAIWPMSYQQIEMEGI